MNFDHIDALAQELLARTTAQGHAVVDIENRHEAEALRAEVRRLARSFRLRIVTLYQGGRVVVGRRDDMPWDPDPAEAAQRFAEAVWPERSEKEDDG